MIPIALDAAILPIAVAGRGPAALRRLLALRAGGARDLLLFSDQPDDELDRVAGSALRRFLPGRADLAGLRALWITGLPDDLAAELAGAGALGARAGQRRGPAGAVRLPQRRRGPPRRSAADRLDRRRQPWSRRSHPGSAGGRVRPRMGRSPGVAARPARRVAPRRTRRGRADRRAAACQRLAGMTFEPGTVWLVGAGPGDPGLLTLHAARALAEADVVLHDALVSPEILALAPQARLEPVGKRAGGRRTPQLRINERLIRLARERQSRGAAEGRRPAGVRPRRRGGAGARRRRRPLSHRPRHQRRHRRHRRGGHPDDASRPGAQRRFRHRPRRQRRAARSRLVRPRARAPTCWCCTWRCARSARSLRTCARRAATPRSRSPSSPRRRRRASRSRSPRWPRPSTPPPAFRAHAPTLIVIGPVVALRPLIAAWQDAVPRPEGERHAA